MGDYVSHINTIRSGTTIILLQNEAELRPTGGFISGVGMLRFNGLTPNISFIDSYAIAEPPSPLRAPLAIEQAFAEDPKYTGWMFRDANFDPDFALSVQDILIFLQNDGRFAEENITAVVSMNMAAVERLIENHSDNVLEENNSFFLNLQRSTKDIDLHSTEELDNRKNVIGEIADQLIGGIGYFELPEIAKEVQIWFADSELQAITDRKNWSGKLPEQPFFAVNVANLGAKKSDRYMRKYYYSELNVDETGGIREWLSIRMKHAGQQSLLSGRGDYSIRVLRPIGT